MLAKKAEKQKSWEKEKKSHHPPSLSPQPLRETDRESLCTYAIKTGLGFPGNPRGESSCFCFLGGRAQWGVGKKGGRRTNVSKHSLVL